MGKVSPWPLLCALLWLSSSAAAERRPDFHPFPPNPPAPEPAVDAGPEAEPEPEPDPGPGADPGPDADPDPGPDADADPDPGPDPGPGPSAEAAPGPRIPTVEHRVLPGETLSAIAAHYHLSLSALLEENPGLQPDRVRAGATLVVQSRPASLSASIGSPAHGRLQRGRQLPEGLGYAIRERARAFGTEETVDALVASFAQLTRRFPRAPLIAVHDLSLRSGGRMTDHRSHQSGRDADLAYPQKRCEGTCEFAHLAPAQLDAQRAFTLLRYLLERDELEAVFIDYRLQKPLYEAARAQGASAEQLARWFQYPRGRSDALGVIRHFPKHADHMHLRFRCHDSDPQCRSFRPLQMQTARR